MIGRARKRQCQESDRDVQVSATETFNLIDFSLQREKLTSEILGEFDRFSKSFSASRSMPPMVDGNISLTRFSKGGGPDLRWLRGFAAETESLNAIRAPETPKTQDDFDQTLAQLDHSNIDIDNTDIEAMLNYFFSSGSYLDEAEGFETMGFCTEVNTGDDLSALGSLLESETPLFHSEIESKPSIQLTTGSNTFSPKFTAIDLHPSPSSNANATEETNRAEISEYLRESIASDFQHYRY